METNEPKPDAFTALDRLTADDVAARIAALERELAGLRPLLRSLRARERSQTGGGRTHGR